MKNKIIDIKKRLSENGKRAVAYLLVASLILGLVPMTAAADTAESTETTITSLGETLGDMNIVPYNNEDLRVDVASGGWATPVVTDYDENGVLDIILGSNSTPYPGVMLFLGTDNAQKVEIDGKQNADYLLMNNADKLSGKMQPLGSSIYQHYETTDDDGHTIWKYGEYDRTLITGWKTTYGTTYPSVSSEYGYTLPVWGKNPDIYVKLLESDPIKKTVDTIDGKTWDQMIKGNNHLYADYDGDGDLDLIYSVDHYGEYGWIYGQASKYDTNGKWGDGDDPIRSWVFLFENVDGDTYATKDGTTFDLTNPQLVTLTKDDGTVAPVDTYAGSTPQFYDWDFDGDLDIICGDWFGEFTYFENEGTRKNPMYKEGRSLLTEDNKILCWTGQAGLSLTSADWNKDGYMDIIASGEDGRVVLIEHTGTKSVEDGTPIFKEVQHFQMPAEGVKLGMEASPCSFDWDQDGDEDIISGNALGYIIFTENLTIDMVNGVDQGTGDKENPTWAKPVPLRNSDDNSIYRITAGDSLVDGVVGGGSPQGPDEEAWGYTTITVGDWNDDNVPDIISNNIWGRVYFHEGVEVGSTCVKRAVPIEVEWENENKHPEWNWWDPEGKELVTVWRTTPFMIDLPLEDRDGDGDMDADDGDGLMDLVMLDHEGYLAYYERYISSDGTLKLKEGKRIFKDNLGQTLRMRSGDYGENGRVKILLVDYNQDGMLDLIYTDDTHERNVIYKENISNTPGEYIFSVGDTLHEHSIYNHSVSPTACDWDENGIPDLLMGAEDGHLYYLKNNVAGETDNDQDGNQDNEGEATPTLDDYLVAHWDFEDDGTGNALKDKATVGITADDLTVYDSNGVARETTDIAIADGVATIKNDASLRTALETAGVSTDLDITGELTLFMKVKVDAINLWSALASKGLANSAYWLGLGNQDGYGLYFSPRKAFSKIVLPKNEWREVAAVVNYNSNSEMVVTIYVSNDSSTRSDADYQYYSERHTDKSALGSNDAAFIIGNAINFNAGDSTKLTRDFEDVRIYNKALTSQELATVMPDTSVEDSLVAHYDFENDGTEGSELQDKSKGGSVKDDLTVNNNDNGTDVTIEDGVATFINKGYMSAVDSADLDLDGEMTLFAKVCVSGTSSASIGASTGYICKNGAYSLSSWWGGSSYTLASLVWGTGAGITNGFGVRSFSGTLPKEVWREMALVVSQNEDGTYSGQLYVSRDSNTSSGEDFVAQIAKPIVFETNTKSASDLLIGHHVDMEETNAVRQIDDIQIYKKALTPEQLAGLYSEEEEDVIKVACVGDSITYGNTGVEGESPATYSYPTQMQTILGDGYQVLNAGVSGHGALKKLGTLGQEGNADLGHRYYGAESLYQTSLSFTPDIVLMMLGTNDAYEGFITNYSSSAWNNDVKAEFIADYTALLESYQALSTNPKIYIVLPPYCYDNTSRQANLEQYIIPALEEIASEKGIEIIDMQAFTANHADWFVDNLHPNKTAYGYMAQKFANHIHAYVGDVDTSLVAHWDFEGDNEEAQLSDKGSGENQLTKGTSVSIADGVATVTGDGYLQAAAAGLDVNEEMTVFARVKVDKMGWSTLLSKVYANSDLLGNANGYSIQLYPNDASGVQYYGASVRVHGFDFSYDSMAANKWREIAFVVSKDADGMYTQKFMISKNEATADAGDFVTYFTRRTPLAEHIASTTDLMIGNAQTPESSNVTRVFDDIRIYNRALTEDELAAFEFTEGTDTTSYYLESLDNTIGFGYYEHIARYNVETANDSVTLTPVAEDAAAVIKVNNEVVTSGTAKTISLVEGANTVTVTLGDGTTVYRTYTLSITRNPVMTEKLDSLVQKVGKYENTGYEAWDLFATALADAEALLASENLNDDEAGKCYKALLAAETQLFAQEKLPPVSLKGFKHVTLEDFGLTSKTYTANESGTLDTSLDQTVLSMKVDFNEKSYSKNRIDIGGFYLWLWKDTVIQLCPNGAGIPVISENYVSFDLAQAGITSGLDEFLLQISFEYKDYDGNSEDDGVQVNVYANGTLVFTKDYTGCTLNNMGRTLQMQQSVNDGYSLGVKSVIGDAHADGLLDPRDLVAVVKKADGTDLGNTYENIVADVNRRAPVDQEDVTGLRSKLLE